MINQLIAEIKKKNAPIVVGLDPMLAYVPEHIQKKAFEEYGETLEGAAEAIWQFNKGIVDAVSDLIMSSLEFRVLQHIRKRLITAGARA